MQYENLLKEHSVNKSFLKSAIGIIVLQSMVIMPLDMIGFDDNDAQNEECQGVQVNLDDESLSGPNDSSLYGDDRATEIAVNTPLWNFKLETDFWFVQTVIGVAVFLIAYKWYKNDPAE
jgi:hypothetical protein